MADPEPPFEQRLRAEGAEQRDHHRGGHDPPDAEAAGEGSVNATKQALRARRRAREGSPAAEVPASASASSPAS